MRLGLSVLLLLSIALAAPVSAQMQPFFSGTNPHLQYVDYLAGQIVQLRSAPGYQLMVELSPDEQIQSIALGDNSSWAVNASKEGDRLFLKATQAGPTTNLTVVTSVRVYNFDLQALPSASPDMPYTVEFRYPAQSSFRPDGGYVDVSAAARRLSKYRMSGDRQLRPTSVSDDGKNTYISWPKSAEIPAIYGIDRSGNEVLLNGMMGTDDVYVVDGVPFKLTFRIDRHVARAERVYSKADR